MGVATRRLLPYVLSGVAGVVLAVSALAKRQDRVTAAAGLLANLFELGLLGLVAGRVARWRPD